MAPEQERFSKKQVAETFAYVLQVQSDNLPNFDPAGFDEQVREKVMDRILNPDGKLIKDLLPLREQLFLGVEAATLLDVRNVIKESFYGETEAGKLMDAYLEGKLQGLLEASAVLINTGIIYSRFTSAEGDLGHPLMPDRRPSFLKVGLFTSRSSF